MLIACVAGVAAVGAAIGLLVSWGGGKPGSPAPAPAPASGAAVAARPGTAAGSATLAAIVRTAPRYSSPGRREPGTVPATWFERPSVLPVVATRAGWIEVRVAQRPNLSTAWLPAADVRLTRTPYRIQVNLATTRLSLYNAGRLVFSTPAGVGTTSDPTPTGQYFVAFDEQPPQPDPGYGPFIMVTSAHSPDISDWNGTGDAVIGIHGPLGDDSVIGTAGARVSHGCIRLHAQALKELRDVPPGTPIDIVG